MTNGISLYYTAMGEGEPVLVVHGGPGLDHQYLASGLSCLADSLYMVFYDQRFSGGSEGTPTQDNVTLDAYLNDLEAIRNGFELGKVNLLGHSWGAFLTLAYAAKFPDNVKSLVLVAPNPITHQGMWDVLARVQSRLTASEKDELADLSTSESLLLGEQEAVKRLMNLWFKTYSSTKQDLDLPVGIHTALNFSKVYTYLHRQLGHFDLRSELKKVIVPVLVVQGKQDAVPQWCFDEIRKGISTVRALVIENSGHFPFWEAPDEFNSGIKRFYKDLNA